MDMCPEKFENLHRCRARKVSPGASCIINHDALIEIAFVFSTEILEEFWLDFAGMMHVFFTRTESKIHEYNVIRIMSSSAIASAQE